jgi:hypothetical protein
MDRGLLAVNLVLITIFAVIVLVALAYSLPILLLRRFQRRNSIFTLNVCLAAVLFCVSWLVHFVLLSIEHPFTVHMATFRCLYTLRVWANASLPLSLVLIPCHRCVSMLYSDTRFFRTKQWVTVCIVCQWIAAAGLAIPDMIYLSWVRDLPIYC